MSKQAGVCYRDYVIVDGQFIGRFDEMYRDVEDPWGCTAHADALPNRVLLALLREGSAPRTVLDVGCGLGVLTGRIYHTCKPAAMHACDVSKTAIAKAKRTLPRVNFFVQDLVIQPILPFATGSVDLIVMAEVVWYILPVLSDVFGEFARLLSSGGPLVLKQCFYPPGEQQYGKESISCSEDLVRYLADAGLVVGWQISIGKQGSSQTWICQAART
jgi:SAM-dependent methyltransferase